MGSEKNTPSKEYFINLLTKDITVENAICELINNAVSRYNYQRDTLGLDEYWISVQMKNNCIQIWDNCGAIEDVDLLKEKLRFDKIKKEEDDSLVIALLKCGDRIELELNNNINSYLIKIDSKTEINSWKLIDQESFSSDKPKGLRIIIKDIYPDIKCKLESGTLDRNLRSIVATKYRYLLDNNIKIKINDKFIESRFIKESLIYEEYKVIEDLIVKVKLYKCSKDRINGWDIVVNDICRLERNKSSMISWSRLRIDGHSFLRFRGEVLIYCKRPERIIVNSIKNIINSESSIFTLIKEFMYSVVFANQDRFKKNYVYIQYEKPEEEVNILKDFFREEVDGYKEVTAKIVGEESFALAIKEYQRKL